MIENPLNSQFYKCDLPYVNRVVEAMQLRYENQSNVVMFSHPLHSGFEVNLQDREIVYPVCLHLESGIIKTLDRNKKEKWLLLKNQFIDTEIYQHGLDITSTTNWLASLLFLRETKRTEEPFIDLDNYFSFAFDEKANHIRTLSEMAYGSTYFQFKSPEESGFLFEGREYFLMGLDPYLNSALVLDENGEEDLIINKCIPFNELGYQPEVLISNFMRRILLNSDPSEIVHLKEHFNQTRDPKREDAILHFIKHNSGGRYFFFQDPLNFEFASEDGSKNLIGFQTVHGSPVIINSNLRYIRESMGLKAKIGGHDINKLFSLFISKYILPNTQKT